MQAIRNSAKAVIIENQQLLTIKKQAEDSVYYTFPGGGQNPGETLPEALERECLEELGIRIKVGHLLYIREYIGKNHEFASRDGEIHKVDFFFACERVGDEIPHNGDEPDKKQIGFAWLPIFQLEQFPLYPSVLRKLLFFGPSDQVYLGDVN